MVEEVFDLVLKDGNILTEQVIRGKGILSRHLVVEKAFHRKSKFINLVHIEQRLC